MRRSRARPVPEDGIAIRVAVLVAVMASAWAALEVGAGDGTLRLVVLIGLPAGFLFSYLTRGHTGWWLKVVLAFGLVFAFEQFLRSVSDLQGGSVTDVQTPLAELFVWVQLLHALDVPTRRDLMFSLASSAALAAIAGVLSVSFGVAPVLALWAVASIAGLVLAHRSRFAELPALTGPRGSRDAGRVRGGGDGALIWIRPVVVTLVAVLVLGAEVFMVIPAAGTARSLVFPASLPRLIAVPSPGGLVNPSVGSTDARGGSTTGSGAAKTRFGYFGFSPTLDTGVRGRPDDTLVMRVRASAPDFWRAQTFDRFDGRVWSRTADTPRRLRSTSPFFLPRVDLDGPRPVAGHDLVQTYFLNRSGPNVLFGANVPEQVYFSDRTIYQLPDGSLRAGVQLDRDATYTVVSRRPDATAATLRASAADAARTPADITERYAGSAEVPTRVRELAARVTRGATTPYDRVRALERWMGRNTHYTLDIPPLPAGADATEQFLFVDRKGFCEQIATSLVVMLRSLGIPARLAVGYLPGERNPFTGLYEVRADDAHAWAEVYFPGVGWQGFDPTASVPLAGDATAGTAGQGALAYLAARLPSLPSWFPAVSAGLLAGTVVTAIAIVVAAAVVLRRRRRRRARRARPWGVQRLERFDAVGATRGRARRPGETAERYARAIGDPQLVRVAAILDEDLYSASPAPPDARAEVDATLDRSAR